MRKFLTIITIGIYLYVIRLWLLCRKLQDGFHIDHMHVKLQIEDITHAELHLPLPLVRVFDNKVVGYSVEAARQFVHFWDPTFLVVLLSITGMFGILCGLYYFFVTRKNPVVGIALILLILVQLSEIFFYPHIPYIAELIILWIGYSILSLFGLWQFTSASKKTYRIWIWAITLLLSAGWLVLFQTLVYSYCAK